MKQSAGSLKKNKIQKPSSRLRMKKERDKFSVMRMKQHITTYPEDIKRII